MEKAQDDAKIQARIINHMNKDHQVSIQAFAQHYGKIPKYQASTARIAAFNLDFMTLELAGDKPQKQTVKIPLAPPLNDYSEARTRMVEMTHEACNALGYSHHVVNEYVQPTPTGWLVILLVILGLCAFSDAENFAAGGWARKYGLLDIGFLADIGQTYSREIWWLIIAIHATEVIYFAKTRMMVYHTSDPKVILLWSLSTFFEGFGNFIRFDRLVEKQKRH